MSKVVDERVVSMQFDNRHFESNVRTTMSTLDKLKAKLNFSGSAKGLESIDAAARKCDLSPLSSAADTVGIRFNAMYTIADQALRNITNSAMAAGKRIASALTIDPVKTGLSEYETKINSVQVIKANTRGKYDTEEEQMEAIYSALDKLNDYADRTIYNYTQMTDNVGKFVAQTGDIDKSVKAVEGLANLAGASGASASDMARATYQMSQALGGTIRKIDWNSLRNANMAGLELKNMLTDLAKVKGIDIDAMIADKGTFEDTLEEGWLTGDLFLEAMNIYSDAYSEAELSAMGFNEEQIKNFKDLAATARQATTEVKTITQMWDVLKETAQSGWTKTWELIIGDFDSAKALLSPLSEFLMGVINRMSDARNNLLQGALNLAAPWTAIMEKLDKAGLGKIKKIADSVGDLSDKLEYFQDVVNKVWHGDYKNADTGRYELLDAAGYDHRVVQDLVNLGLGYKLTVEDIEASHAKFGLTLDTNAASAEEVVSALESLTDEQLRNAGLTEDEIKLYRDLEKEAKRTGKSINELADEMSKADGRTLLIEALTNAGKGLVTVFTAVKDAWVEIFPPMSVVQLYNIIKGLNSFSKRLIVSEETADKLKRTLKGVFAIIDIVATIVGGGFRIAFKAVSALLGYFNLDILDVTAAIGDALVGFRDWIDSILDFKKVFSFIGPYIEKAADAIKRLVKSVKDSKGFEKFVSNLSKIFGNIRDWFVGIKDAENIPKYIIEGLVKGLTAGVKAVWNAALAIGKAVLESIKKFLGIHSPSTEMEEVGTNVIDGLVNGIKNGASKVWETVKGVALKIVDVVKNIDFGSLLAVALSAGLTASTFKLASALTVFGAPLAGLGDMFEEIGDGLKSMFTGIGKNFRAAALEKRGKAVLSFAIAIGVLAAAVYVLTKVDSGKMWEAIGAIAALSAIMIALSVAIGKLGPKESLELGKFSIALLGISGSLFIIAKVMSILSGMDNASLVKGGAAVIALSGVIVGLIASTKLFGKDSGKIGGVLIKMSLAILLMVGIIKLVAGMNENDIAKGLVVISLFGGIFTGLIAATKLFNKDADKVGTALFKMSAAMLLMIVVIKLIAGMNEQDILKGLVVIVAFGGIFTGLIAATKLFNKDADKVGAALFKMSLAMVLMTVVIKLIAGMNEKDILKGLVAITAFGGIIVGLIAATKLAGKDLNKIGATLLLMSVSIGILALIATLLGFLSLKHLAKGVIAVGILAAIMSMMVLATKNAQDCKGNLIVMTVAIGVMAAAVAALSLIDTKKLIAATASLSVLMGMFALLIKTAGSSKAAMGPLITLTVVVGLLAGLLYILSTLPSGAALSSAASLSLLLVTLTGVMVILSKTKKIPKAAIGNMTLLGLVVAELAVVLSLMNAFGATASLANVISLSALLLVITGVMVILSKIKKVPTSAVGSLALLGLVVAELAVILGLMNAFGTTASIENVVSLSALLLAMSGVLAVLAVVGKFGSSAYSAIGAMALLGLVIAELAVILGLMNHFDVKPSIETAKALSILLATMSGVLVVLGVVGLFGPAAFIGIGALAALIAGIGGLIVGIGALMTKFPQLEEFLNKGIPVLEKIGHALGSFFGNIIGGFLGGITSALPDIGEDLSAFMEGVQPFIDGAKSIDQTALDGVKNLAGCMTAITGASFLEGLKSILTFSWVSGESSAEQFAKDLPELGKGLKGFSDNLGTFTPEQVTSVTCGANAIKAMAEASKVIKATPDWLKSIVGDASIETFAGKLPTIGANLSSFATNLGTFGEDQVKTVTCGANAIKAMSEASKNIPAEGGMWQAIAGEKDIESYAEKLPVVGTNLAKFATALADAGFNEEKVTLVTHGANAIKAMSEATKDIPRENGMWQAIAGEKDIETYAEHLPAVADALISFATAMSDAGFDESKVAYATHGANAIKAMIDASKDIDGQAEWTKKLFGDNSISTFAANMPAVGTALAEFTNNLGTFDETKVATVNCGVKALKSMVDASEDINGQTGLDKWATGDNSIAAWSAGLGTVGTNLKNFANNLGDFDESKIAAIETAIDVVDAITDLGDGNTAISTNTLSNIGTKLEKFATGIKDFCEEMPTNVPLATAKANLDTFMSMVDKIGSINTTNLSAVTTSLNELSNTSISKIVEGFGSPINTAKLNNSGEKIVEQVISGVEKNTNSFKEASTSIAESGVAAVRAVYSSFYSAGVYLVQGFATGISANSFTAVAKAKAMAESAISAAREALKINSPSKVFIKLGKSIPEGFAMGINDFGSSIEDSSIQMARTAIDGTKNAIMRVAELLNSDIDTQPTIRPVLDLSDVTSGASAINSLFGMQPSVGLLTNVGSISTMMNGRQNGISSNDDVVAAIKDLKAAINESSGDSYAINGITYDDGSNIANTIKTLVRATRIEGRI